MSKQLINNIIITVVIIAVFNLADFLIETLVFQGTYHFEVFFDLILPVIFAGSGIYASGLKRDK
ncbi:MAG: hypothetical protein IIZ48_04860 [Erysipelotrichales bacterium]|nr:hypothetical protein [Erysipelotrichales bacterium]